MRLKLDHHQDCNIPSARPPPNKSSPELHPCIRVILTGCHQIFASSRKHIHPWHPGSLRGKKYHPLYELTVSSIIASGGGVSIDFKNEVSQRYYLFLSEPSGYDEPILLLLRRLTEALLQRDFGISLDLPENRLCPPVSLAVACQNPRDRTQ